MSYSNLVSLRPGVADGARSGAAGELEQPLVEAWNLVRQVRQAEFLQERPLPWLRLVSRLGTQVQASIKEHIEAAERNGSLPAALARTPGEIGARALAQLEEHRRLASRAAVFARRCQVKAVDDIWAVVDVAERAIELEILIARHHNRLRALAAPAEPVTGAPA